MLREGKARSGGEASARPPDDAGGSAASRRAVQISVIGAAEGEPELLRDAEEVGRALAEAGAVLVCGGLTGVMEARLAGRPEAGGVVDRSPPHASTTADANEHVTYAVATGIGHARNLAVVASGDAVIAVGGAWGTLSEIAFARKLGKPVVALDSWTLRNRAGTDLGIDRGEDAGGGRRGRARLGRGRGELPERTQAAEDSLDLPEDRG